MQKYMPSEAAASCMPFQAFALKPLSSMPPVSLTWQAVKATAGGGLGAVDGTAVGAAVGATLGATLGATESATLGATEGAGLALLTTSLAVGSVYWLRDIGSVTLSKLLTFGLWAAYAIAFGLRLRGQLLSRRFAWTCLVLFAAALISLGLVDANRHPLPVPTAAVVKP